MKKIILGFISIGLFYFSNGQWNSVTSPTNTSTIFSTAYNGSVIMLGSDNGKVYISLNDGQSWVQKSTNGGPSEGIYCIDMIDNGYALAVGSGGGIGKTVDYGLNWTNTDMPGGLYFVQIASDNNITAYAAGQTGTGLSQVFKTTNSGLTWSPTPTVPPFQTGSGAVVNQNVIFLGGISSDFADGKIAKSIDGGNTWSTQTLSGALSVNSIHFYDAQTGWLACNSGKIYITANGGTDWSLLAQLPISPQDIKFKDFQKGWVIGGNGEIYYTANSGGGWVQQPSNTTASLNSISFNLANNNAVIGGLNGIFLRSSNGGGVLPLSLNHFNGKAIDKTILLSWQTASEQNNKQFDVERSHNNNWQPIATLKGKGNSNLPGNYSFTDERPLQGTNKYRLKQTDFDGKFTYSQILSVKMQYDKTEMSISPNPASDNTVVRYILAEETTVNIDIINADGQKLRSLLTQKQSAGSFTLNVNTKSLTKGLYYVRLITGKNKLLQKLVVN